MNDTPVERGNSIWTRLRRRKVVQWGVAYAAGAWLLMQVLEYFGGTFHWPEQIQQLTTLALLIGLPVVLVLAWYHGDRGQQRVGGTELTILAALLALGGFLLWRYEPATETRTTATATTPAPARDPPNSKSIAVLPFADMSPAKDQEYMSDGIAEELLNLLAKVPDLKVIARTSSFAFKDQTIEIAEIAKRLNVAHVLEGSVRKSGDTVRITAQLIRASDSTHLWSERYDRPLDDIFAVQDEIAADVVKQLKVALLGAAPTVRQTNPGAFALYLQARQLGRQRTAEAFEQSDALYQKVLAIDPAYAPAWDGLSTNCSGEPDVGMRSYEEGLRLAREANDKALAIDPNYAAAHATRGYLAMLQGDVAGAAPHIERALALDPSDLDVLRNVASLLQTLGRLNEAIAIEEYVVARDPVNVAALYKLGLLYYYAGRFDEAITLFRTALSLASGRGGAHYMVGAALLLSGRPEAALAEMQQETSEALRMIGLPLAYHALGRTGDSNAALAALKTQYEKGSSYNIAYVYAFREEADRAFEWLDKAVEYGDTGLYEIVTENLFANIHNDPRWLPFLRKIGKAPEQLAAIKFDVKVPN